MHIIIIPCSYTAHHCHRTFTSNFPIAFARRHYYYQLYVCIYIYIYVFCRTFKSWRNFKLHRCSLLHIIVYIYSCVVVRRFALLIYIIIIVIIMICINLSKQRRVHVANLYGCAYIGIYTAREYEPVHIYSRTQHYNIMLYSFRIYRFRVQNHLLSNFNLK